MRGEGNFFSTCRCLLFFGDKTELLHARQHKVFIHAGSILEKIPTEDRLHNTSVAFNREGKEVARYRKIHMFDITAPDGAKYHESAAFKAGDAVVTYDCEGFKIGCAICYDLRFPYLFQALAQQNVDIVALPAAFTLVNLPSVSVWAGFGVALRRFLSDPARLKWFNIAMGLLLAASLLPLLR